MCRSYLKLISALIFISLLIALIDTCARKQLFYKFHFTVEIYVVEVVYYYKQVFHLLYDTSVTPVEAILYLFIILQIVVLYNDMMI